MAENKKSRNIVIEWGDVKHRYIQSVEKGEDWPSQPTMNYKLAELHRDPYQKDEWEGGSGAETLQYLREGFRAEEFLHAAEYVPTAQKIRNVWNEEDGDADAGKLIAGDDNFFLGAQKRLSKPGLRIQIEFAFAWTVSSKSIQEYGAWCAGFLGALESEGFDLVVDMWIPLDDLYVGDRGMRSNVLIRVKRPNEVSDFTEWSALFGPTGYRQLGFTAKCVAGDKIGKQAVSNLGTTIGGKSWGVVYDPEDALVMVTANQRAGGSEAFPKDKLNAEATAAGLLPDVDFSQHG